MAAQVERARAALLRLQTAGTKFNASIRVRFPPSHKVRRTMESTTSGWANDMPTPVRIFAARGEDCEALASHPLGVFSDGVADLVDEAQKWAGEPKMTEKAVPIYPKIITLVEEGLFQAIGANAREFFEAIRALPGDAAPLTKAECDFWAKYQRMAKVLEGANRVPATTAQVS